MKHMCVAARLQGKFSIHSAQQKKTMVTNLVQANNVSNLIGQLSDHKKMLVLSIGMPLRENSNEMRSAMSSRIRMNPVTC